MLDLASEWIFEKGDRKSYSGSPESEYIRTNLVQAKIDKSGGDSLCTVCRKVAESRDHIVSGCRKLGVRVQEKA